MIATLKGHLTHKFSDHVIIDVNGVGYKVALSQYSLSRLPLLGELFFLFIHTSVREDDISLFGFMEEQEKRIFKKLISVNGIGPKLALTILSGIPPRDLVEALMREDLVRLTAISGIGKKTAERMILDLKDKLTELLVSETALDRSTSSHSSLKHKMLEEALSALLNLGYTQSQAEKTLAQVPFKEDVPLESLLRDALKSLSESTKIHPGASLR